MRFLSLRAVFLLGFVIAMPVLALPPVARRIDELLYGAPPSDFARPPQAAHSPTEEPPSLRHGQVLPARFDEPSPAIAAAVAAAANRPFSPPALAAAPDFAPRPSPTAVGRPATAEPTIDDRSMSRLQQIRQRLEQLGADYVVVETQDGGRFRFHCRMVVDDRKSFTRPFEATSPDCVAAGEQVLREVETWRLAARENAPRER